MGKALKQSQNSQILAKLQLPWDTPGFKCHLDIEDELLVEKEPRKSLLFSSDFCSQTGEAFETLAEDNFQPHE